MFGRLLEYLGSFWRQQRLPHRRGERYQVVACLVNLTGAGDSARDFHLAEAHTLMRPRECNLAAEDAAAVLDGIACGQIGRCILPFIPLMQKGDEEGIIQKWLEVARAEPDARKRGDYGGLALVFADLTNRRPIWKNVLKEWNMQQSQQVLEWQAEAKLQGELQGKLQALRDILRMLLEDHIGPLPETLLARIDSADSVEQLQSAVRQAPHIKSPDELQL